MDIQAGETGLVLRLAFLPMGCFLAVLVTDLTYWMTTSFLWVTFSVWLLFFGLVLSGLFLLAALIDLIRSRRPRITAPSWLVLGGNGVAIALSFINALVHSRDGYTAVVPTGLALSATVVLILVASNWVGAATGTGRLGVSC